MSTLLSFPPAVYSFRNIDLVYDFLLSIGMKPYVELRYSTCVEIVRFSLTVYASFMPVALSSGNSTVFHYQGGPFRNLKQCLLLSP
jgi:xylan 1,4-beta-xylosidase